MVVRATASFTLGLVNVLFVSVCVPSIVTTDVVVFVGVAIFKVPEVIVNVFEVCVKSASPVPKFIVELGDRNKLEKRDAELPTACIPVVLGLIVEPMKRFGTDNEEEAGE